MSSEAIRKEARYWLVRQQSGEMQAPERAAFEAWLGADESHRQEFERVASLWGAMDEFRSRSFPAREAARRYRHATIFGSPFLRLASAFALVVAVTLVYLSGSWNTPEEIHRTAKGERSAVTLADGSQVELNTDTELRVAYSRKARTIHLDRGEALFTVASDRDRPFEVMAGAGRIVDLSTSFNVHREDQQVSVTVVEGAVSVTTNRTGPIHLARGDMLSYAPTGSLLSQRKLNPDTVVAWREGRMKFDRTPLSEVMSQLARYHPISYAFSDPRIGELKISGTFRTDDFRLLLDTLEAALPVQASVDGRFVQLDHAAP